MDFNSVEEVEAYSALRIENKIDKIEKKLNKLRYIPTIPVVAMALYIAGMDFIGHTLEHWITIILIGVLIILADQASAKRTDLLNELFDLKNRTNK